MALLTFTFTHSRAPYTLKSAPCTRTVCLSSAIHQLCFMLLSQMPYAIGQVQDAGYVASYFLLLARSHVDARMNVLARSIDRSLAHALNRSLTHF